MISREESEARIPSVPIEMPSETAMVVNSSGNPPAARTPSLAALARRASGQVAGGHLVPRGGDPDLGAAPVVVAHPHRPEHGPGRGPLHPVGDVLAARLVLVS